MIGAPFYYAFPHADNLILPLVLLLILVLDFALERKRKISRRL
jgi:hypothetical protein